ncbi:MAG: hypothetical protein L0H74_00680 [Brachybacterium sp.]|nr:hypothetical protein [Brachybacterium sp.]
MLFAICSDRGSPGCTTVALALASARGLPAVVVEADPYGGDLALRLRPDGNERHPLPPTPTVLGIGAGRSVQQPPAGPIGLPSQDSAAQQHLDLWRGGSHTLSQMVRVVPGFVTAEQGTGISWPVLSSAVQAQPVPVFADLGRIHTGSPSMAIATAADVLMPVCRGDMASVVHMVERLEHLTPEIAKHNGRPPVLLPIVVTDRRHGAQSATRIAEILSESNVAPTLRGVGWLAWDHSGVHQLEHGADPAAKPMKKSHLMRSARRIMWRLGMVAGLDHAEPEDGRRNRAEKNQQRAARAGAPQQARSWPAPTGGPLLPKEPPGQETPAIPPTQATAAAGAWARSETSPDARDVPDPWQTSSSREMD